MKSIQPVRGRVYAVRLDTLSEDKYFVVVSNNQRNLHLDSVLAVRVTTSTKPRLSSIVELPATEVVEGRILCDDIVEVFKDEFRRDLGAISLPTMLKVEFGLRAALGM